MFEEMHWQAWAERERARVGSLRPARDAPPSSAPPTDPLAVDIIARGVTELRRRNAGLCDDLMAHYGLGHRGPAMIVRPARNPGRRPGNPRVDLAKRWVEDWSQEHAH